MIPPAFFFFLKIVFATWDLLCFHTIFRIIFSSSFLFLSFFALFPCDLVTIFSVLFGFLSLFLCVFLLYTHTHTYIYIYIYIYIYMNNYFKLVIS